MTPYFQQDGITLYNGDNVQTMQQVIPDASIDLVVTSPPYDNLRTYGGHSWNFEGLAAELWRAIKPGGVVVWIVNDATIDGSETGTSFRQALHFKDIGFRLHDTMIYQRDPQFPDKQRYQAGFEFMFVLSKGQPTTVHLIADKPNSCFGQLVHGSNRQKDGTTTAASCTGQPYKEYGIRLNIWKYATGGGVTTPDKFAFEHPAMFPEKLARDHILSWSNEGDIVLDPFAGSGTTLKMARLMGRQGIGIEIHERYCEIAAERLRQRLPF